MTPLKQLKLLLLFRTKWKRQTCLGLELFAGNSLQRWMQRQPNLLAAAAAAAAYRSSASSVSDAASMIGPFGSALLSEAKAAVAVNHNSHRFNPANFPVHHQD